jgi:tetratricopeptide (TPR) repeat protein
MTKAAFISFGLAALVLFPATVPAQDNAATVASNEAVLRQAETIVLRQKLTDAKAVAQRGDLVNAAKLYQESVTLADQIGSGIDAERQQAVAGLAATRLTLARDAQSHGDLLEAQNQVQQVLRVDPKNGAAIAFKEKNDQMLAAMKGRMPSTETLEKVPQMQADKTAASTLVQDGKLFYEMGKYEEAEAKLNEALVIDPQQTTATYYLNLVQQMKSARDSSQHQTDLQIRMEHVQRDWTLPKPTANLPDIANPYATNQLIYTGPGRQAIVAKLARFIPHPVSFDGVPLSEVIKQLSELTKLMDPERKGINFLINNNPDLSGTPVAATALGVGGLGGAGGFGGRGADAGAPPVQLDPNTGLPIQNAAAPATTEQQDVGSFLIKIPSLSDVRLQDVLDAIQLVADHPIRYSIQDFAIVFSAKGPETPQLFMRTFRVDPNTFYSGLENVSVQSFGATSSGSSGGGGGAGGGGGGGGASGQQGSGAVVGVVNAFSGAGSLRNTGTGGGGGGGGGGSQGGSGSLLNNQTGGGGAGGIGGGGGGGGAGGAQNQGGLAYITTQTSAATPSELARIFFTSLGVNLIQPPGKSVFFNDRLGVLFVKATESDLDTIERAIQVLNSVPPQVHIKARFIEVEQDDSSALGFDWTIGQISMGQNGGVVASGGTAPSLGVPVSSANPLGAFPGNTAASLVPGQATDQILTSGLRQSAPTLATITGIMTDPNFRVAIRALEQRSGTETLGEPEATTTSGRQTQMRATSLISVVTGLGYQQGTSATTTTGAGGAPAP